MMNKRGANARYNLRFFPLLLSAFVVLSTLRAHGAGGPTYGDVAPIFQKNCIGCHSGSDSPKGLRLDSYGNILRGSRRGPVILPGSSRDSELMRRIKGISQPRMPLTGPPYLSDTDISLIEKWIDAGVASGPPAGAGKPAPNKQEVARPSTKTNVTYRDVEPIFQESCIVCHSGSGSPRGLRLDTYESIKKGSDGGPVVVPKDPEGSELVRRIKGLSQPRMPLTGPPYLEEAKISLIEEWVASGALPAIDAATETVPAEPEQTTMKIPGPGDPVTYSHVAPIFLKRCVKCHAEKGQMGGPPEGLILKTRAQILAGGERAVVIPGNPEASKLVRHITGRERPRMPFDGPPYLSEEEIRLISDWISRGAPDDRGNRSPMPAGARIRLRGTLTGYWEVDGTPLTLAPGVRIKKGPSPGDHVEVRGTILPDGSIRADRIRRR